MYRSLPSLPTGVFVHAMLRVSCNTSDDHQPRVPIYSSSLCQSSSQWCTDDDSMMQNANASARKWNLVDFSDPRSTKSRFKSWLMHPASIGLFTRTSSQPRRHSHHCGASAKQRIHCDLACHYPLLLGCWSWSRRSQKRWRYCGLIPLGFKPSHRALLKAAGNCKSVAFSALPNHPCRHVASSIGLIDFDEPGRPHDAVHRKVELQTCRLAEHARVAWPHDQMTTPHTELALSITTRSRVCSLLLAVVLEPQMCCGM